jgi:hypothetical protein
MNELLKKHREAFPDDNRGDWELMRTYVSSNGIDNVVAAYPDFKKDWDDMNYNSSLLGKKGILKEFGYGVLRGVDQLQQMVYGAGALGVGFAGGKESDTYKWLVKKAAEQGADMEPYSPTFDTMDSTRTLGDWMNWAAGKVGEQIPQFADSIAVAAAGGLAGAAATGPAAPAGAVAGAATGLISGTLKRAALKKAVARIVSGEISKQSGLKGVEELASHLATPVIAKSFREFGEVSGLHMVGAEARETLNKIVGNEIKAIARNTGIATAGYLNSAAINAGDIFTNMLDEDGNFKDGIDPETAFDVSMLGGVVAGVPDSVLPSVLAKRFMGGGDFINKAAFLSESYQKMARAMKVPGMLQRFTRGVAEGIGTEMLTEGIQEYIAIAAERYADPSKRQEFLDNPIGSLTESDWSRLKEAAAAGGLVGGVAGGAGSVSLRDPIQVDDETKRANRIRTERFADFGNRTFQDVWSEVYGKDLARRPKTAKEVDDSLREEQSERERIAKQAADEAKRVRDEEAAKQAAEAARQRAARNSELAKKAEFQKNLIELREEAALDYKDELDAQHRERDVQSEVAAAVAAGEDRDVAEHRIRTNIRTKNSIAFKQRVLASQAKTAGLIPTTESPMPVSGYQVYRSPSRIVTYEPEGVGFVVYDGDGKKIENPELYSQSMAIARRGLVNNYAPVGAQMPLFGFLPAEPQKADVQTGEPQGPELPQPATLEADPLWAVRGRSGATGVITDLLSFVASGFNPSPEMVQRAEVAVGYVGDKTPKKTPNYNFLTRINRILDRAIRSIKDTEGEGEGGDVIGVWGDDVNVTPITKFDWDRLDPWSRRMALGGNYLFAGKDGKLAGGGEGGNRLAWSTVFGDKKLDTALLDRASRRYRAMSAIQSKIRPSYNEESAVSTLWDSFSPSKKFAIATDAGVDTSSWDAGKPETWPTIKELFALGGDIPVKLMAGMGSNPRNELARFMAATLVSTPGIQLPTGSAMSEAEAGTIAQTFTSYIYQLPLSGLISLAERANIGNAILPGESSLNNVMEVGNTLNNIKAAYQYLNTLGQTYIPSQYGHDELISDGVIGSVSSIYGEENSEEVSEAELVDAIGDSEAEREELEGLEGKKEKPSERAERILARIKSMRSVTDKARAVNKYIWLLHQRLITLVADRATTAILENNNFDYVRGEWLRNLEQLMSGGPVAADDVIDVRAIFDPVYDAEQEAYLKSIGYQVETPFKKKGEVPIPVTLYSEVADPTGEISSAEMNRYRRKIEGYKELKPELQIEVDRKIAEQIRAEQPYHRFWARAMQAAQSDRQTVGDILREDLTPNTTLTMESSAELVRDLQSKKAALSEKFKKYAEFEFTEKELAKKRKKPGKDTRTARDEAEFELRDAMRDVSLAERKLAGVQAAIAQVEARLKNHPDYQQAVKDGKIELANDIASVVQNSVFASVNALNIKESPPNKTRSVIVLQSPSGEYQLMSAYRSGGDEGLQVPLPQGEAPSVAGHGTIDARILVSERGWKPYLHFIAKTYVTGVSMPITKEQADAIYAAGKTGVARVFTPSAKEAVSSRGLMTEQQVADLLIPFNRMEEVELEVPIETGTVQIPFFRKTSDEFVDHAGDVIKVEKTVEGLKKLDVPADAVNIIRSKGYRIDAALAAMSAPERATVTAMRSGGSVAGRRAGRAIIEAYRHALLKMEASYDQRWFRIVTIKGKGGGEYQQFEGAYINADKFASTGRTPDEQGERFNQARNNNNEVQSRAEKLRLKRIQHGSYDSLSWQEKLKLDSVFISEIRRDDAVAAFEDGIIEYRRQWFGDQLARISAHPDSIETKRIISALQAAKERVVRYGSERNYQTTNQPNRDEYGNIIDEGFLETSEAIFSKIANAVFEAAEQLRFASPAGDESAGRPLDKAVIQSLYSKLGVEDYPLATSGGYFGEREIAQLRAGGITATGDDNAARVLGGQPGASVFDSEFDSQSVDDLRALLKPGNKLDEKTVKRIKDSIKRRAQFDDQSVESLRAMLAERGDRLDQETIQRINDSINRRIDLYGKSAARLRTFFGERVNFLPVDLRKHLVETLRKLSLKKPLQRSRANLPTEYQRGNVGSAMQGWMRMTPKDALTLSKYLIAFNTTTINEVIDEIVERVNRSEQLEHFRSLIAERVKIEADIDFAVTELASHMRGAAGIKNEPGKKYPWIVTVNGSGTSKRNWWHSLLKKRGPLDVKGTLVFARGIQPGRRDAIKATIAKLGKLRDQLDRVTKQGGTEQHLNKVKRAIDSKLNTANYETIWDFLIATKSTDFVQMLESKSGLEKGTFNRIIQDFFEGRVIEDQRDAALEEQDRRRAERAQRTIEVAGIGPSPELAPSYLLPATARSVSAVSLLARRAEVMIQYGNLKAAEAIANLIASAYSSDQLASDAASSIHRQINSARSLGATNVIEGSTRRALSSLPSIEDVADHVNSLSLEVVKQVRPSKKGEVQREYGKTKTTEVVDLVPYIWDLAKVEYVTQEKPLTSKAEEARRAGSVRTDERSWRELEKARRKQVVESDSPVGGRGETKTIRRAPTVGKLLELFGASRDAAANLYRQDLEKEKALFNEVLQSYNSGAFSYEQAMANLSGVRAIRAVIDRANARYPQAERMARLAEIIPSMEGKPGRYSLESYIAGLADTDYRNLVETKLLGYEVPMSSGGTAHLFGMIMVDGIPSAGLPPGTVFDSSALAKLERWVIEAPPTDTSNRAATDVRLGIPRVKVESAVVDLEAAKESGTTVIITTLKALGQQDETDDLTSGLSKRLASIRASNDAPIASLGGRDVRVRIFLKGDKELAKIELGKTVPLYSRERDYPELVKGDPSTRVTPEEFEAERVRRAEKKRAIEQNDEMRKARPSRSNEDGRSIYAGMPSKVPDIDNAELSKASAFTRMVTAGSPISRWIANPSAWGSDRDAIRSLVALMGEEKPGVVVDQKIVERSLVAAKKLRSGVKLWELRPSEIQQLISLNREINESRAEAAPHTSTPTSAASVYERALIDGELTFNQFVANTGAIAYPSLSAKHFPHQAINPLKGGARVARLLALFDATPADESNTADEVRAAAARGDLEGMAAAMLNYLRKRDGVERGNRVMERFLAKSGVSEWLAPEFWKKNKIDKPQPIQPPTNAEQVLALANILSGEHPDGTKLAAVRQFIRNSEQSGTNGEYLEIIEGFDIPSFQLQAGQDVTVGMIDAAGANIIASLSDRVQAAKASKEARAERFKSAVAQLKDKAYIMVWPETEVVLGTTKPASIYERVGGVFKLAKRAFVEPLTESGKAKKNAGQPIGLKRVNLSDSPETFLELLAVKHGVHWQSSGLNMTQFDRLVKLAEDVSTSTVATIRGVPTPLERVIPLFRESLARLKVATENKEQAPNAAEVAGVLKDSINEALRENQNDPRLRNIDMILRAKALKADVNYQSLAFELQKRAISSYNILASELTGTKVVKYQESAQMLSKWGWSEFDRTGLHADGQSTVFRLSENGRIYPEMARRSAQIYNDYDAIGGIGAFVRNLVEENPDAPHSEMLSRLMQSVEFRGIAARSVSISGAVSPDSTLAYKGFSNQANQHFHFTSGLHSDINDLIATVAHEVSQAIIINAEQRVANGTATAIESGLIQRMKDSMAEYSERLQRVIDAGGPAAEHARRWRSEFMPNLSEFIASAISEPAFQQDIKAYRSGGLWGRIYDAVIGFLRRLFGYSDANTLYDQLIGQLFELAGERRPSILEVYEIAPRYAAVKVVRDSTINRDTYNGALDYDRWVQNGRLVDRDGRPSRYTEHEYRMSEAVGYPTNWMSLLANPSTVTRMSEVPAQQRVTSHIQPRFQATLESLKRQLGQRLTIVTDEFKQIVGSQGAVARGTMALAFGDMVNPTNDSMRVLFEEATHWVLRGESSTTQQAIINAVRKSFQNIKPHNVNVYGDINDIAREHAAVEEELAALIAANLEASSFDAGDVGPKIKQLVTSIFQLLRDMYFRFVSKFQPVSSDAAKAYVTRRVRSFLSGQLKTHSFLEAAGLSGADPIRLRAQQAGEPESGFSWRYDYDTQSIEAQPVPVELPGDIYHNYIIYRKRAERDTPGAPEDVGPEAAKLTFAKIHEISKLSREAAGVLNAEFPASTGASLASPETAARLLGKSGDPTELIEVEVEKFERAGNPLTPEIIASQFSDLNLAGQHKAAEELHHEYVMMQARLQESYTNSANQLKKDLPDSLVNRVEKEQKLLDDAFTLANTADLIQTVSREWTKQLITQSRQNYTNRSMNMPGNSMSKVMAEWGMPNDARTAKAFAQALANAAKVVLRKDTEKMDNLLVIIAEISAEPVDFSRTPLPKIAKLFDRAMLFSLPDDVTLAPGSMEYAAYATIIGNIIRNGGLNLVARSVSSDRNTTERAEFAKVMAQFIRGKIAADTARTMVSRLTSLGAKAVQAVDAYEKRKAIVEKMNRELKFHQRNVQLNSRLMEMVAKKKYEMERLVGMSFEDERLITDDSKSEMASLPFKAYDGASLIVTRLPSDSVQQLTLAQDNNRAVFNMIRTPEQQEKLLEMSKQWVAWLDYHGPNTPEYRGAMWNRIKAQLDQVSHHVNYSNAGEFKRNVVAQIFGSGYTQLLAFKDNPLVAPLLKSMSYAEQQLNRVNNIARTFGPSMQLLRKDIMKRMKMHSGDYDSFNQLVFQPVNYWLQSRVDKLYAMTDTESEEALLELVEQAIDSIPSTSTQDQQTKKLIARMFTETSKLYTNVIKTTNPRVRIEGTSYYRDPIRAGIITTPMFVEKGVLNAALIMKQRLDKFYLASQNIQAADNPASTTTEQRALDLSLIREAFTIDPSDDLAGSTNQFHNPRLADQVRQRIDGIFSDPQVWLKFVQPLAHKSGQSAFWSAKKGPGGFDVLASSFEVRSAFEGSGGSFFQFAANLYEISSNRQERTPEDFAAFIHETLKTAVEYHTSLMSDALAMGGGNDMASVPHYLMDERNHINYPMEWVGFHFPTPEHLGHMLHRMVFHDAFGRDLVLLNHQFKSLKAFYQINSDKVREIRNAVYSPDKSDRQIAKETKALAEQQKLDYNAFALNEHGGLERQLDSILESIRTQVESERHTAVDSQTTAFLSVVKGAVAATLNKFTSVIVDTSTMFRPVTMYGLSTQSIEQVRDAWLRWGKVGSAGILAALRPVEMNSEYDEMRARNGFIDTDHQISLKQRWASTQGAFKPSPGAGYWDKATNFVGRTGRYVRDFLSTGYAKPGSNPVIPTAKAGIFLWNTQVLADAASYSSYRAFSVLVMKAAEFLQSRPGYSKQITAADLGYKNGLIFRDEDAGNAMISRLGELGYDLNVLAEDLNNRKAEGGNVPVFTDDVFNMITFIGSRDMTLDAGLTTRKAWMTDTPMRRAIGQLLGWSTQMTAEVALRAGAKPRGGHDWVSFRNGLMTMAAMGGIGLLYGMMRDEWDRKVLGKKANVLWFGEASPGLVVMDNLARVGTLGLGGELVNSLVNLQTARDITLDSRIFVANFMHQLARSAYTLAAVGTEADYQSFFRPTLQAIGGQGVLEGVEMVNNLMGPPDLPLFREEKKFADRTNVYNWLRAAGRAQGLSVMTFAGRPSELPTVKGILGARMQLAALADDRAGFEAAMETLRRVLLVEGGPDADEEEVEKSIAGRFRPRHPLSAVFKSISESEYEKLLASLPEDGRRDVMRAVELYNQYLEYLGEKPYYGTREKKGASIDSLLRSRLGLR